jgi:hypothetical protein
MKPVVFDDSFGWLQLAVPGQALGKRMIAPETVARGLNMHVFACGRQQYRG